MKEITICHQYYDKTHFKALYEKASDYGFEIKDYVILSQYHIFSEFYKMAIRNKRMLKAMSNFLICEKKLIELRFKKDNIIIVGLAPYDRLMNRYEKVFRKNYSIYFTSWQYWDGTKFPRGNISNKEKFEKYIHTSFKGVACVSIKTEEQVKRYNSNTSVVNHAIDTELYRKKSEKIRNGHYIYLGRFIDVKNVDLILKYFKGNKNVTIDFVGWGEKESLIREYADESENIKCVGKWNKNMIQQELCNYDYLILPSKEEPFGIVLLEALASGVPCIVSNAFGPNEIIKNGYNGFVFDKCRETEFVNLMDESIKISNKEYADMCINALESSLSYNSENIVKKWISLIE